LSFNEFWTLSWPHNDYECNKREHVKILVLSWYSWDNICFKAFTCDTAAENQSTL